MALGQKVWDQRKPEGAAGDERGGWQWHQTLYNVLGLEL
jgi:hypothetical protein